MATQRALAPWITPSAYCSPSLATVGWIWLACCSGREMDFSRSYCGRCAKRATAFCTSVRSSRRCLRSRVASAVSCCLATGGASDAPFSEATDCCLPPPCAGLPPAGAAPPDALAARCRSCSSRRSALLSTSLGGRLAGGPLLGAAAPSLGCICAGRLSAGARLTAASSCASPPDACRNFGLSVAPVTVGLLGAVCLATLKPTVRCCASPRPRMAWCASSARSRCWNCTCAESTEPKGVSDGVVIRVR
mmetsp:Transcript_8369/g.21403  ORF Transcript_8369/g.21403 Transcript_8369/m.21403 type:complete len:248 (-) Transcript_8369:62-805(-)